MPQKVVIGTEAALLTQAPDLHTGGLRPTDQVRGEGGIVTEHLYGSPGKLAERL